MNFVLKIVLLLMFSAINLVAFAEEIRVDPENAVILLPREKNDSIKLAAEELRNHLKLISGCNIQTVREGQAPSGKYIFSFGKAAPADSRKLAPEEARWKVTLECTYLYGDDSRGRRGTLFAVYDFLETVFKVRWIQPDDIAFEKQSQLKLTLTSSGWKPILKLRSIRVGLGKKAFVPKNADLKEFTLAPESHMRLRQNVSIWQKRMRMGSHDRPVYGHAFIEWWKLYGKKHPEYFALTGSGTRGPVKRNGNSSDNPVASTAKSAHNIKLCVSNQNVVKQVVENWKKQKNNSKYINACVNDSPPKGFCRCTDCRKLDVVRKGEKFSDHLTDRYVDFANRIVKEAEKYNPNAKVVIYAYNESEYPPRRVKLDKNVTIGLVTTHFELDKINKLFSGWEKMGAKEIFFRPNQHHYYFTGSIPAGFEKHFYDVMQTAYKNNTIGFDYDCLINVWLVNGMADYILAKAMSDPSKSFDYWENHYLDAFGKAKPDIKQYYDYWRKNVWNKRIGPDLSEIVEKGRWYNFVRGLMWNLGKYYKESDFDKTDISLKNALKRNLTTEEKRRIERLLLANQHSRLVFKAVTVPPPEKFKHSLALLDFREKHKDLKNTVWAQLFNYEGYWGDITGVRAAVKFKDYSLPFIKTPHFWYFKLDPKDEGIKSTWYNDLNTTSWDRISTNNFWEKPYKHYPYPSAVTRKKLKNYNGIAWYSCNLKIPSDWKKRDVFLYFGAVDESCWIYVNGKLAGKHLFEKPDDWNSPFAVDISKNIDWSKNNQHIAVRIEDKSGSGGIWKPVWMVSKK